MLLQPWLLWLKLIEGLEDNLYVLKLETLQLITTNLRGKQMGSLGIITSNNSLSI
jgi:hypothetical protein